MGDCEKYLQVNNRTILYITLYILYKIEKRNQDVNSFHMNEIQKREKSPVAKTRPDIKGHDRRVMCCDVQWGKATRHATLQLLFVA